MSRSVPTMLRVCVLLALLFGCAQEQVEPTAIVLYVDGDVADFDRATYRVSAADGDGGKATSKQPDGSRAAMLPQTFVILKGEAERVLVEVTALDKDGVALLTQRAYVTFQPNKTIGARITLAEACRTLACARSCSVAASGAAMCADIQDAPTKPVEKRGDEREWDAGIAPSSGSDGGMRDAGPRPEDAQTTPVADSAVSDDASAERVDAAPRCSPSRAGGKCNVVSGCGCENDPGTHCQSREGSGPVCAVIGTVPRNHRCDANEECGQGLACVGSVCRKYCDGEQDCDGDCVPTSSTIIEKVCIERCALGAKCGGTGVDCVQRKGDTDQGRCLFGREDCAKNNRMCEEPVIGTGICARGTDAVDCCPKLKGNCDLVDSCGCREGQVCQLPHTNASADADCRGIAGGRSRGETCSSLTDCAKGLGCFGGLCAEYCHTDQDCDAKGKCTTLSDLGVAYCRYPCTARSQNAPAPECRDDTVCVRLGNEAFCGLQLPLSAR